MYLLQPEMQFFLAGGLSDLKDTIVNNWLAPVFLLVVAIFAITFLKNRQFRQLAAFVGIAVIVGILIFFGDTFFGQSGTLTEAGKDIAGAINMILFRLK